MHLIPTGNFLRDLGEVEKRITIQTRDRQTAERFGAKVATMMKRRSLAQPVQMATACIGQRAKDLVMRNKAGWARVPASPQKFILVDPQGCVLTDLDGKEIPPPIGVSLPPFITRSPAIIIDAYRSEVTLAEGTIPHIYLDTDGNPTVGIGHLMKTETQAKDVHARFGFYKRDANGRTSNVRATEAEVVADYRNVIAHKIPGAAAGAYKKFTTVDLTTQGIKDLREHDIETYLRFILNSRQNFPNFLTYPLKAQLALLDMVFNRGFGTVTRALSFVESVRNRDWKSAARISENVGTPSPKRKNDVKSSLDKAALAESFFINPKCPRRPILQIAP